LAPRLRRCNQPPKATIKAEANAPTKRFLKTIVLLIVLRVKLPIRTTVPSKVKVRRNHCWKMLSSIITLFNIMLI